MGRSALPRALTSPLATTRALARDPDNPDGLLNRGILRRLTGDEAGARRGWLRAIAPAEGTPTAHTARANLEMMDLKAE